MTNPLSRLCAGDPYVRIVDGFVEIVHANKSLRLPRWRNCDELAYMLREAGAELEKGPWTEREAAWARGEGVS